MLLFGCLVLNIVCVASIRVLRKRLKEQYDTIMGMGTYIHAHTGRKMEAGDFRWYRDYWRKF